MKILLATLLTIISAHAVAATQVLNCPSSGTAFYKVATPAKDLSSKLSTTGADPSFCNVPSKYPNSYFISVTQDGGAHWAWVTLKSLGFGIAATATPTTGTAHVSWTAAPAKDVSGAAIAVPLSYNVYRSSSATVAGSLIATVTGTTKDDIVPATTGVNYCYTVGATAAGYSESVRTPAVCVTFVSGVLQQVASPITVTVK